MVVFQRKMIPYKVQTSFHKIHSSFISNYIVKWHFYYFSLKFEVFGKVNGIVLFYTWRVYTSTVPLYTSNAGNWLTSNPSVPLISKFHRWRERQEFGIRLETRLEQSRDSSPRLGHSGRIGVGSPVQLLWCHSVRRPNGVCVWDVDRSRAWRTDW